MNPNEREVRQVMIELNILAPRRFVVAFITAFPFLAFMHVVGLMTAVTGFWEFDIFIGGLGMA